MRAPCRRSSRWTSAISTSPADRPVRSETAAPTPASCPLTAQHILFLVAACATRSPPMARGRHALQVERLAVGARRPEPLVRREVGLARGDPRVALLLLGPVVQVPEATVRARRCLHPGGPGLAPLLVAGERRGDLVPADAGQRLGAPGA